MNKKLVLIMLVSIFNSACIFSQASVKVMFYNVLNFPLEDAVPNRISYLETILNDYKPDIFMVCELNNASGANTILQATQTQIDSDFEMATFQLNTSDDYIGDQNDLQNLIYYNSSKFNLESQTIVTTLFRDFNHYRLKFNSENQDTEPLYLDAIVCHLKASSGTENQQLRYEMVQDLTFYLNTLPASRNVILAGDFNVYTNSEPAFQELINTDNNITFADPANKIGSWHNNTNYADVFTQSTRTQTGFGGTTGGFDDRFDFILTSENMLTNTDVFYKPNTYQVFGNNGNIACYNQAISDPECAGSLFSTTIREALHNFSDHLPVTLEVSINQSLLHVPEFTSSNSIEIVGTNSIDAVLKLKINNQAQALKSLKIYNILGQQVKTIPITNAYTYRIAVQDLSSGMYYIVAPNMQTEPLKFIKTN